MFTITLLLSDNILAISDFQVLFPGKNVLILLLILPSQNAVNYAFGADFKESIRKHHFVNLKGSQQY